jgi:hypothetical protein
MKKTIIALILCLSLVSILSTTSQAMGLRAMDLLVNIDYEPGYHGEYSYTIVTNSGVTEDYNVFVDGDLSRFVKVQPDTFANVVSGETRTFNAIVDFPNETSYTPTPGMHRIFVGATETETWSGGQMGAKTASKAIIDVKVLYPGKYLIYSLNSYDMKQGETKNFTVTLSNWGKQTIDKVNGTLYITDGKNEIVRYSFSPVSVQTNIDKTISIPVNLGNVPSGKYFAKLVIDWDGNRNETQTTFKVGQLDINILNFTRSFSVNEINEFTIDVQSIWNDPINDVYADVTVYDGGSQITTFRTPKADLGPWARANLSTYFNTKSIKSGTYLAIVKVYYGGSDKSVNGTIVVGPGIEKPSGFSFSDTIMWIILIILIIVIFVILVIVLRRRKR